MSQVGVQPQKWRAPVGTAAEKAARLKLNGHVLTRSPLSRVVELEALLAGVEGKRSGWRTLRHLAKTDDRFDVGQLDRLIARSLEQSELLERVRSWAIDQAFTAENQSTNH